MLNEELEHQLASKDLLMRVDSYLGQFYAQVHPSTGTLLISLIDALKDEAGLKRVIVGGT